MCTFPERLTRERLLNIHHLPSTRLHEAKIMLPAPLQPIACSDLPVRLQVALVTSDNAHGQDLVLLHPVFSFDIDHLRKVLQRLERARLGDVIDQEECIAFEIRLRPKTAVFFLASSIREAERVCRAVDCSRYGVGVLNCRVVPAEVRLGGALKGFGRKKTYSWVHWLRTKRSVIEDFPQPPSPQTVIVIRWESSMLHVYV